MGIHLKLLGAFVVLVAVVSGIACKEAAEPPSPTQPPLASPGTIADTLKGMALQADEVPQGFLLSGEGATPPEAGNGFAMYSYAYSNNQVFAQKTPRLIFDLQSSVLHFDSADRAKEAVTAMKTKAAEPKSEKVDPSLIFDTRGMTPMEIAIKGADDFFALHDIVQPRKESGIDKPVSRTIVAIRRGEFVSVIITVALEDHPATTDIMSLAEKAGSRLQSAVASRS